MNPLFLNSALGGSLYVCHRTRAAPMKFPSTFPEATGASKMSLTFDQLTALPQYYSIILVPVRARAMTSHGSYGCVEGSNEICALFFLCRLDGSTYDVPYGEKEQCIYSVGRRYVNEILLTGNLFFSFVQRTCRVRGLPYTG